MALLKAELKRGFLRSLARAATKSGASLREALEAFQDQGFNALKNGRLITATSGAGNSVQFAAPEMAGQLTPDEVFGLSEELLTALDYVVSKGTASDDDDAILAAMLLLDNFQTINTVRQDFTLMNFPAVQGIVP